MTILICYSYLNTQGCVSKKSLLKYWTHQTEFLGKTIVQITVIGGQVVNASWQISLLLQE